jgi:hypothetical protein
MTLLFAGFIIPLGKYLYYNLFPWDGAFVFSRENNLSWGIVIRDSFSYPGVISMIPLQKGQTNSGIFIHGSLTIYLLSSHLLAVRNILLHGIKN